MPPVLLQAQAYETQHNVPRFCLIASSEYVSTRVVMDDTKFLLICTPIVTFYDSKAYSKKTPLQEAAAAAAESLSKQHKGRATTHQQHHHFSSLKTTKILASTMDEQHGKTGLAFPLTLVLMQAFIFVIWVLYGSYAPGKSNHPSLPPSFFLPSQKSGLLRATL